MKAAIFDLDDTLVRKEDGEERTVQPVSELAEKIHESQEYVSIVLTARAETVRDETRRLLDEHDIEFDELYMRPEKDFSLTDDQFKERILKKLEEDGFDISFVVEDKNSVAEMWEKNGIDCLKLPERRVMKNRMVRRLRRLYRFLPRPLQRLYLYYYQKRFS